MPFSGLYLLISYMSNSFLLILSLTFLCGCSYYSPTYPKATIVTPSQRLVVGQEGGRITVSSEVIACIESDKIEIEMPSHSEDTGGITSTLIHSVLDVASFMGKLQE